jgi:nicotinamidase-related amidase
MTAHMIHRKLTLFNCVVILIDFERDLLLTINSINAKTLIENVSDLARIAHLLNIPTIMTTIETKSFGGPLISQLQMIFPSQEPIECTTMSVWEESRVSGEVKRTGRRKLIMAGLWTDFCVALSTIQALESGYEIYVVSDACGDLNTRAQDAAIRRMVRAGATSIECRQVLTELQRHEPLRMPDVHNSVSDRKRRFL